MPNFNNFGGYPNNMTYGNYPMNGGYNNYPQAPNGYPQQQQPKAMEWVDGEAAAKAFPLPQGWPVNMPMPLWDSNDPVIYLKSINQMGMPNPLKKLRYVIENDGQANQSMLPAGDNMTGGQSYSPDMSKYVTKDDMEKMVGELKNAINSVKETNRNGKQTV